LDAPESGSLTIDFEPSAFTDGPDAETKNITAIDLKRTCRIMSGLD
jgi:hypothetical protein